MLIICFCYISLSFMGNIQISVYANEYDINDLSKSIIENNKKLVKKIINKNGIDINQKDSDGRYPLEKVLVMENCEMAKLLLDNGANPFVITKGGQSIYKKVMNTPNKTLKKIFEEDIRKITGGQDFVGKAPVNLIFVANYKKVGEDITAEDYRGTSQANAGFMSQNVYLYCASEGLATVVRGWYDREKLHKAMKLEDFKDIIYCQTVGYPN